MSEMREEMIRTLDRIMVDYPLLFEPKREAVEERARSLDVSGDPLDVARSLLVSDQSASRREALADAGFTQIGGTGADGDITFADAAAIIRRCAYHSLDVEIGDLVFARRIAARAGFALGSELVGFAVSEEGEKCERIYKEDDCDPTLLVDTGTVQPVTRQVRLYKAADGANQLDGTLKCSGWGGLLVCDCRDDAGAENLALVQPPGITVIIGERDANIAGQHRRLVRLQDVPEALPRQKVVDVRACSNARQVLLLEGALLRAIEMAGAIDRTLEHCLTWVNDRVQFGRPIAKFQAIQHLMAQIASEAAAASAAVDLAVEASTEHPDPFAVAIAKARAGEAAGKVANFAHAVFGAMGFTREHTLHYSTRRLWAWRNEFGNEAYWQAEIGRTVAKAGGARLWATLTANG